MIAHYNMKTDKPVMRSVTSENIQQCLEDIGLGFCKYNQFKAHQQKQRNENTKMNPKNYRETMTAGQLSG